MWAKLNDAGDTIEEIISSPKSMTIDGIKHPRQMFQWTTAELKAVGIVPITTSGTSLDERFYIEKDEAFAIAGDKNSVVKTIGEKAGDKKLADEDAVDKDGNKLKDDDGNQMIVYGLKTQAKDRITNNANARLQGFNWLIQRKVTADTAIPSAVITYMAAVRTAHASICTAIDNASDIDAFKVLHTTEYNEDGSVKTVAKVDDWPDDSGVKGNRR